MPLQSTALDKIRTPIGYGKSSYTKEDNPAAYKHGPANFLFYNPGTYYPLPSMARHGGYSIHASWRREAGNEGYKERVAGDCAFVGNFYKDGEGLKKFKLYQNFTYHSKL